MVLLVHAWTFHLCSLYSASLLIISGFFFLLFIMHMHLNFDIPWSIVGSFFKDWFALTTIIIYLRIFSISRALVRFTSFMGRFRQLEWSCNLPFVWQINLGLLVGVEVVRTKYFSASTIQKEKAHGDGGEVSNTYSSMLYQISQVTQSKACM